MNRADMIDRSIQSSTRQRNWLDAYAAVFARANRIVTGADVEFRLTNPQRGTGMAHAPGWTDGKTIHLNRQIMADLLSKRQDKETILAIKGVNYHEVAHCIFMPRMNSKFVRGVKQRDATEWGTWQAFNVLEDMRDETLFAGTFTTAVIYFTNAVATWILANPQSVHSAYPLITGRRFLPKPLRDELRKVFQDTHGASDAAMDRMDEIARQYLHTVFPKDTQKALNLVVEYRELVNGLLGMMPDTTSHGHQDAIGKGSPIGQGQQEAAVDNLDISLDEWEERDESMWDAEDDEDSKSDSTINLPAKQRGEDDEGEEGEGSGGSGAPSEDGDEGDENSSTPSPDDLGDGGYGTGGDPDSEGFFPDDLSKIAQAITEQIKESEDFLKDLQDTQEAVKAEFNKGAQPSGTMGKYIWDTATEDDAALKRRIIGHLREITSELEPTWHHRQSRGTLNIRNAMLAQHGDLDVFDRWDEGREEEAGVEMAILLDQSTSMGTIIDRASHVLWSLKSALDRMDIRTTVFGFSDGWTLLMKPDDKITTDKLKRFGVYGGTDPEGALKEAYALLNRSSKPHKAVIIITDGDWYDTDGIRSLYRQIRRIGGVFACIRLDRYGYGVPHGFEVEVAVNPSQLEEAALVIERLAKELMAQAWQ